MALTKIGDWTNPISSEADRPNRSATDMKAIFDSNTNQIKTAFNTLVDDVEAGDADMAFTEAATRANIVSGESMATILGKVKKFMTDAETAVSTVSVDSTYPNRYLSQDGTYTTPTAGESVNGVARGGTVGQYYRKKSATDYDGEWATVTPATIGAAAATHASQHGNSGTDPLTPGAIGAIADPATKSSGQVLKYDGSAWSAAIPVGLSSPLWENASPSSTFGEQTVNLSGSAAYTFYLTKFLQHADTESYFYSLSKLGEKTASACNRSNSGAKAYASRSYTVSSTTAEIGPCYVTGTQNNAYSVPIAIYGVTGVAMA